MEKRVLLISSQETFMVNAMKKNLESEYFNVEVTLANVNAISQMPNRPQIFLVYLDKDVAEMKDTLVYLKDVVDGAS